MSNNLINRVVDKLGLRLVAYVLGETDSTVIQKWCQGKPYLSSCQALGRLLIIEDLLGLCLQVYDVQTFISWFHGMNPALHDKSPGKLIRESTSLGNLWALSDELTSAMRTFIEQ